MIKSVRESLDIPVAIMLDTKGPEYRIGTFEGGKITLAEGDPFSFTTEDIVGNQREVSVNYKNLPHELSAGDRILLNNGLLIFVVDSVEGERINCTVQNSGVLSNRKSMSFPGKVLNRPYLSEQDKKDIAFGVENGIDYIACSFVSNKENLIDVREYLASLGAFDIELIAKIENQSGVDNIEQICEYCDGIMVARGDMGVEVPFEQLPSIQKKLITKCRMLGKRVITATEMLESMIQNPRPTRAEISDVANAVYDGTSAVMLSGETAAGAFPVESVATMSKIAQTAEQSIDYRTKFYSTEFKISNAADAVSHATCAMAIDIEAKAIVACTMTGMTARMVSRFRSPVDIIGLTNDEGTWRRLSLSWGVIPELCEKFTSTDVLFYYAKKIAAKSLSLSEKDKIVITGSDKTGAVGSTNLIKIEEI